MNIRPLLPVTLLLFCACLAGCRTSDTDREANRLFVEAYQLTQNGLQSEATDPAAAHSYYRQAVEKIDYIIANYPGTTVAVDVTQRRTRIGDTTIGELRDKVPRLASRARSLESFHNLALYLAELVGEEERALKKLAHARRLYDSGQRDRHDEVAGQVVSLAERHWNRELTDRFYYELSVHFAELSRWDQSLRFTDLIQDQVLLFEALFHILERGFIRDVPGRPYARITAYLDYMDPVSRIKLIDQLSDGMFAAGYRPQAVALLQEKLPEPADAGNLDHINALSQLSATLAMHGEFDLSRMIIGHIEKMDSNYADFVYRDLAIAIARHGDHHKAVETAERFERAYFQQTALASIAVELAKMDSISAALALLERVPDSVEEKTETMLELALIPGVSEDVVDSLLQAALPRIPAIGSPLVRAGAHILVADIHLRHDRRSLAAEAMEQAEEQTGQVSDPGNINRLITTIIKKWLSLGRPDRALDAASWYQMDHSSFEEHIPDLFTHAITRGFHDFARTLAGMTDRRAYFLFTLVSSYLDQRMISQPSELAYEIRDFYWRSFALAHLSIDLKNKVNLATAERAATDALLVMQRIRDRDEKQKALFHTASLFASAEISMNPERRSLVTDLLSHIDN